MVDITEQTRTGSDVETMLQAGTRCEICGVRVLDVAERRSATQSCNGTSAATGLNNKHIICIKTYLHILILYHLIVYVGLYLLNIYYILHYIFATIYTQTGI